MASVIDPSSGLPVLELGPGTGIITKAILRQGISPEELVSIEFSTDFYQHLVRTYPGVNFINGDAFDLDRTLAAMKGVIFDSVISAIPLLSFPMERRIALLESALARLPAGRPFMQITYGPVSPIIANPDRYRIKHYDFVMRNIPPAQLWIYTRG
jgi:phosphatidylethanolamine/phosphatidyl-N-methylethanolamine N-methyltransferase